MASLAKAVMTIPSFTCHKAGSATVVSTTAASTMLAGNALAIEVLLELNDGALLRCEPSKFSMATGKRIVFKNNAAFPYNVVFDEDKVPSRVNATAISMSEDGLLNGPGETFTIVTLQEKGIHSFYCAPH